MPPQSPRHAAWMGGITNRGNWEGAIQQASLPNAGASIRLIAPFISWTAATALSSPHFVFVTRIILLCRWAITHGLAWSITSTSLLSSLLLLSQITTTLTFASTPSSDRRHSIKSHRFPPTRRIPTTSIKCLSPIHSVHRLHRYALHALCPCCPISLVM